MFSPRDCVSGLPYTVFSSMIQAHCWSYSTIASEEPQKISVGANNTSWFERQTQHSFFLAFPPWSFESWNTKLGRAVRHDNAHRRTRGRILGLFFVLMIVFTIVSGFFLAAWPSLMNEVTIWKGPVANGFVLLWSTTLLDFVPILKNQGAKMNPEKSIFFP